MISELLITTMTFDL